MLRRKLANDESPTHGATFQSRDEACEFLDFLDKEFKGAESQISFEVHPTANLETYLMFIHVDDSLIGDAAFIKIEQLYNKFQEQKNGKELQADIKMGKRTQRSHNT